MVFRLIVVLAIAGALAVFTVQNLTPLLPLVFLGIQFPPLPLSWWVLGAIGAGALSMVVIQILLGLSNFVTGQTVRSRVKSAYQPPASRSEATADPSGSRPGGRQPGRDRATPARDDSAWQDWRGYEAPAPAPPPRSAAPPVDDWDRPPSDDWEFSSPRDEARRPQAERAASPSGFESSRAARPSTPPPAAHPPVAEPSRDRVPREAEASPPDPVVDADYRVIVPPYRPLDEAMANYTPPPPPPPVPEDNADDWFEDTSDDFGEPASSPKPTSP